MKCCGVLIALVLGRILVKLKLNIIKSRSNEKSGRGVHVAALHMARKDILARMR